jgi:hypothetical protein
MTLRKSAIQAVAVLAVAFGAGHLVQSMNRGQAAPQGAQPTAIEPVAAGPEAVAPGGASDAPGVMTAALGDVPATPVPAPAPLTALPQTAQPLTALPLTAQPQPQTADTQPPLPPIAAPQGAAAADPACAVLLDLVPEAGAMLGVTLVAPCAPEARVVLRHAGLAVTGRTSATGTLLTTLPALETAATVTVRFPDGSEAAATLDMPEVASLRRFGVQWMADDAFQVHAFEAGASYGEAGHISAATPGQGVGGAPPAGGFLSLLGDASVDLPMLAEIYTFPADPALVPEVVVEAAVTEATCGRELLGETVTAFGGEVYVTELTLATPDCGATGDILVLKNLVPDLKIATAD